MVMDSFLSDADRADFTAATSRFTTRADIIYATALDWPRGRLLIRSLAEGSPHLPGPIASVELIGDEKPLAFERRTDGLLRPSLMSKISFSRCKVPSSSSSSAARSSLASWSTARTRRWPKPPRGAGAPRRLHRPAQVPRARDTAWRSLGTGGCRRSSRWSLTYCRLRTSTRHSRLPRTPRFSFPYVGLPRRFRCDEPESRFDRSTWRLSCRWRYSCGAPFASMTRSTPPSRSSGYDGADNSSSLQAGSGLS